MRQVRICAKRLGPTESARHRESTADVLRNHHRSMRQVIRGACGEEGVRLVGLDVPPVRPMLGVREHYGLIFTQMGNPALPGKLAALAAVVDGGSPPDVEGILDVMQTRIRTFEDAQATLNEAKKLRDQAYAAKTAALKRLRKIVVNVARIQEGYYRLIPETHSGVCR